MSYKGIRQGLCFLFLYLAYFTLFIKFQQIRAELIPTSYDSLTHGISLAPSQHQNIKIRLILEELYYESLLPFSLKFSISLKSLQSQKNFWIKTTKEILIKNKNLDEFYKFTFEDFDESIQYGNL